ncbi:MAG: hypothetical protein KAQ88_01210 [Hyphomicrobiaceae bacterium]|nr:hypothetical protein [Hyphomicrobiaceae bacterium]
MAATMDSGARFNANELRHLSTDCGRALLAELSDLAVVYRDRLRRGSRWSSVLRIAADTANVDAIDARLALAAFFDRLGRVPILAFDDALAAARLARLIE